MDSTKCAVCSSTKEIKLCSGCKTVCYCSLAHQKQHWKIHKKTCFPVKIVIKPLKEQEKAFIDGQGDERDEVDEIILTRDLKTGSVILDDVPILTIPIWEENNFICLTCGIPLSGGVKIKNCSKCNWPICSKQCEENPLHKDNECTKLRDLNIKFPPIILPKYKEVINLFKAFLVAKTGHYTNVYCLLIQYFRLQGLISKDSKTFESFVHSMNENGVAKISDFMQAIKAQFDKSDVKEVQQLLNGKKDLVNILFMLFNASKTVMMPPAPLLCVYKYVSRCKASCLPTTKCVIDPITRAHKLTAKRDLVKGEILSYEQLDFDELMKITRERQLLYISRTFIKCSCQRCLDPTELGTFFGAMTCTECRPDGNFNKISTTSIPKNLKDFGYFLPQNPLDINSIWKCNNKYCGDIKPWSKIDRELATFQKECDKFTKYLEAEVNKKSKEKIRIDFLIEILQKIDDFFENKGKKCVHPNHSLIIVLKIKMIHSIFNETNHFKDYDNDELPLDKLEYVLKHFDHVGIQATLVPHIFMIQMMSNFHKSRLILMAMTNTSVVGETLVKYLQMAKAFNEEAFKYVELGKKVEQGHLTPDGQVLLFGVLQKDRIVIDDLLKNVVKTN